MARKRTKAAKQAQTLLVWLESLNLPARVINALRRDLEVVTGEREGEGGSGVLAGLDQAQFAEELYRPRGGQIGKVPTVAKSALEALRAAIPAPVTGDAIEATQSAKDDAAPERAEAAQEAQADTPADATQEAQADAAPESVENAQPTQDGDEPADIAQQGDESASAGAAATQETLPAMSVAALADAQEELIAEAALEATEPPADVAPEAVEPAEMSAAPAKRRPGRPRRGAAAEAAQEPAEAPVPPAKPRGRLPHDEAATEAAAGLAPRTRRARVAAALTAAPPAAPPAEVSAPVVPAAPPVADPSFAVLLRLWRELHPQGQRAAMSYMASLAAEG